jgi:hypothetical protein
MTGMRFAIEDAALGCALINNGQSLADVRFGS